MKAITPGHLYQLENYKDDSISELSFYDQTGPVQGTTNEEVLRVLIDRIGYLQTFTPCRQNAIVLTMLEQALMWLNHRTEDRVRRGVEGTPDL